MIRTAIIDIENNAIVNVIDYNEMPLNPPPGFTAGHIAIANDRVGMDWSYHDGALVEPIHEISPSRVPTSISDRQFFQQLAVVGKITQAEALAAVKVGTIPPVLQTFVDAIADPAAKFSANMLLAGATVFERAHPMTEAIGQAQGMTSAQIDDFFRAASAL